MNNIVKKIKVLLLLFLLSVAALCDGWATPSYGDEKKRIAIVVSSSIAPYKSALYGFKENLKESGIDYSLSIFYLDKASNEEDLISKVRDISPHIIHTIGTSATRLAKREFIDTPIVFSMVLNPVSSGLVNSMKSPDNNITGASMDIPLAIQFTYIKKILPAVKNIGVIYSEAETGLLIKEAEKIARQLGLNLVKGEIKMAGEVPQALRNMKGEIDLLWSVADSNVFTRETIREILLTTLREKIPFMGLSPAFVRAGALSALDTSATEIGGQAGVTAKKILFGLKPGDIPVDVPDKVKIVINKNTIDSLGITIPKEILKRAEIIEP